MFPPQMLQYEPEFSAFLDVVRELDVRSYLEIGSKFGGTLWRVGMAMPKGSRCVFVDLERSSETASWKSTNGVMRRLTSEGRSCKAIWGDSTSEHTIRSARALGPYDAVFIDANHFYNYVSKDWENYSPMATKFVAFHDIRNKKCEVPRFWGELRERHEHREITLDPAGRFNGIGIIMLGCSPS